MGDKCVVCGEADEGKPLYKKLGSGEYNVEVITALRVLELTSLSDTEKNDHYICWDCDETIVAEYGRFMESEEKHQVKATAQKEKKRLKRAEQREKKKLEVAEKCKNVKRKSTKVDKPGTNALRISPVLSKTKQLEIERAKNAYNASHCLLCDSTFDCPIRGFQRFSLKKIMIDDLDVASVIEHLGLARHITPEMKSKRFVCTNCFITLRRNYKDKSEKGSTLVDSPADVNVDARRASFHRATPEEHAAEIAKLLPPALAECYKIMTSKSFDKQNNKSAGDKAPDGKTDGDHDEDEGELRVSQDQHGNFVVNMKFGSPSDKDKNKNSDSNDGTEKPEPPLTPRKKKNILLPKRHHHHLKENREDGTTQESGTAAFPTEENPNTLESRSNTEAAGTCNVCGRTFFGKPAEWWHNLNSPLTAFESITVSMALQLLETSLASTSERARLACQVCLPCYGMVSSGFRIQIVQRIARQKNIDPSKVNLAKVKFQMMRKEDINLLADKKTDKEGKENILKNNVNIKEEEKLDEAKNETAKLDVPVGHVNDEAKESDKEVDKKRIKRKNSIVVDDKGIKKVKLNEVNKEPLDQSNADSTLTDSQVNISSVKTPKRISPKKEAKTISPSKSPKDLSPIKRNRRSWVSEYDSHDADKDQLRDFISEGDDDWELSDSNSVPYRDMSSDSDFEIGKKSQKKNKNKKAKKHSQQIPVVEDQFIGPAISKVIKPLTHSTPTVGGSNMYPQVTPGNPTPVVKNKDINCNKVNNIKRPTVLYNSSLGDKKNQMTYNINSSCTVYFALSKMKECKLELKDIRKSLPKEAFEGKSLNVRMIPGTGYQVSICNDSSSSSLQYILNTMALPHHYNTLTKEGDPDDIILGCCVVCASICKERRSFWHNLEEDINPPSVQVPVRWVCASLSIAPVIISEQERQRGLVCRHCFINLCKEFDIFVRTKIGESCDIPPAEVEVHEYIVTFNQSTMNIEADPVELTPEDEIEESERILAKIMPTIMNAGLDELCGEYSRVPMKRDEYTIWLLLVLNEFRVQLREGLQTLAEWLTRLMPVELRVEGYEVSAFKLMSFVKSLANESSTSKDCFENLNRPIPQDLFVMRCASSLFDPSEITMEEEEEVTTPQSTSNEKEMSLYWEDFLTPVNLDDLFRGEASPLSREYFNNGLLYAFWRLSQIIEGDEEQLADWIKQVSPITLEKGHLAMLLNAPVPLHEHLENHPEDLAKLKCVIIPESVKIKPKAINNYAKSPSITSPKTFTPNANITKHSINQPTSSPGFTKNTEQGNSIKKPRRKRIARKNFDVDDESFSIPPASVYIDKSQVSQTEESIVNDVSSLSQPQVGKNHVMDLQANKVAKSPGGKKAAPKVITDMENVNREVSIRKPQRVHANSFNDESDLSGSETDAKSLQESISLTNKVKELEKQLQAMKQENHHLLIMNQKMYEATSTDEHENTTHKVRNKDKTNASKVENAVNSNKKKLVKQHLPSTNTTCDVKEKVRNETSSEPSQGTSKPNSTARVKQGKSSKTGTPEFNSTDRVILLQRNPEQLKYINSTPKVTTEKVTGNLKPNNVKPAMSFNSPSINVTITSVTGKKRLISDPLDVKWPLDRNKVDGKKTVGVDKDPGKKTVDADKDPGKKTLYADKDPGKKTLDVDKDAGKKTLDVDKDPGKKTLDVDKDPGKKATLNVDETASKKASLGVVEDADKKLLDVDKDAGKNSLDVDTDSGKNSPLDITKDAGEKNSLDEDTDMKLYLDMDEDVDKPSLDTEKPSLDIDKDCGENSSLDVEKVAKKLTLDVDDNEKPSLHAHKDTVEQPTLDVDEDADEKPMEIDEDAGKNSISDVDEDSDEKPMEIDEDAGKNSISDGDENADEKPSLDVDKDADEKPMDVDRDAGKKSVDVDDDVGKKASFEVDKKVFLDVDKDAEKSSSSSVQTSKVTASRSTLLKKSTKPKPRFEDLLNYDR